jgi:hypothetical protein
MAMAGQLKGDAQAHRQVMRIASGMAFSLTGPAQVLSDLRYFE